MKEKYIVYSKIFSDWLPSCIKAAQLTIKIFKMVVTFQDGLSYTCMKSIRKNVYIRIKEPQV